MSTIQNLIISIRAEKCKISLDFKKTKLKICKFKIMMLEAKMTADSLKNLCLKTVCQSLFVTLISNNMKIMIKEIMKRLFKIITKIG